MSAVGNGCKCGGALSTTVHDVTTDKGASEWAGKAITGPATVERQVCTACGRERVKVYRDGAPIATRG